MSNCFDCLPLELLGEVVIRIDPIGVMMLLLVDRRWMEVIAPLLPSLRLARAHLHPLPAPLALSLLDKKLDPYHYFSEGFYSLSSSLGYVNVVTWAASSGSRRALSAAWREALHSAHAPLLLALEDRGSMRLDHYTIVDILARGAPGAACVRLLVEARGPALCRALKLGSWLRAGDLSLVLWALVNYPDELQSEVNSFDLSRYDATGAWSVEMLRFWGSGTTRLGPAAWRVMARYGRVDLMTLAQEMGMVCSVLTPIVRAAIDQDHVEVLKWTEKHPLFPRDVGSWSKNMPQYLHHAQARGSLQVIRFFFSNCATPAQLAPLYEAGSDGSLRWLIGVHPDKPTTQCLVEYLSRRPSGFHSILALIEGGAPVTAEVLHLALVRGAPPAVLYLLHLHSPAWDGEEALQKVQWQYSWAVQFILDTHPDLRLTEDHCAAAARLDPPSDVFELMDQRDAPFSSSRAFLISFTMAQSRMVRKLFDLGLRIPPDHLKECWDAICNPSEPDLYEMFMPDGLRVFECRDLFLERVSKEEMVSARVLPAEAPWPPPGLRTAQSYFDREGKHLMK